ncbi:MAG: hypothetical protein ACIAXF_05685 [Phycisphaerales bacterium JB063]
MPKPTSSTPHPDDQLPTPLRWATQLFSSWWVLGLLALLLAGYTIAAFVPVAGRYLWQAPWLDIAQSQMLGWLPFHLLLMLSVCVLLWTTLRRVPWHWRNLGLYLSAIGIATALLGLSTAWRFQTRGLLAVQTINDEAGALQTRYLDPVKRVLFVQVGNEQPQQVPLAGLPRWHDRGSDTLTVPLHQTPGLRSQLNYRAQVHIVAYLAHGQLEPGNDSPDTLRSVPTPLADRGWPLKDCPPDALIAVRFTANSAAGPAGETTVWLPFDLAAGQRVLPPQTYEVAGLGPVRLAFTLASQDLGFAIAAEPAPEQQAVTVRIVDTDPKTRQIIPAMTQTLPPNASMRYEPATPQPTLQQAVLAPGPSTGDTPPRWVTLRSTTAQGITLLGAALVVAGLLLTFAFRLIPDQSKPDAAR